MIWAALYGLVIGSFLNVVIYRLPRPIGFAVGRSRCPHCSRQLKWHHNIPLFSYLFLKGKCAYCSGKISVRYPVVEAVNALLYAYFYHQFGISPDFLVFSAMSSALIVIFFIDLDFQIIPDAITLPGMIIGLGISFLPEGIGIVDSVVGLVAGGGSLYLIALLGDRLFKKESMGGGDIKMAAMLGSFLGWQKIILVFIVSAVIGLVVSLVAMVFSSRLRQNRVIPFGPFLAMAALLSIVYGERIIDYYLTHFAHLR